MKDEVSENFILTKLARTSSFRLPPSSFPIVPLAVPSWNGETYRAILRSLASAAIVDGPDIHALKFSLVERLGVADAVLCGSGSLSLELALRACSVQPDDEVIIPAFCCSALVPPILALGALPVLADIGDDLNLTVETLDAAITRKTKAVIVPHLFGNPADIQTIVELAQGKKIRVIDDAAQALGATIDNRPLGSFGDAGIVSFGGEKICFGIGGGALVTNRRELVAAGARNLPSAQLSAVLGKLAATQFHWRWRRWTRSLQPVFSRRRCVAPDAPPIPYVKSAIANLQASVAFSLMQTLDENIAARRARVSAYRELLGHETGLELIAHGPGSAC
jgi:dTDP-4-amino-4,6-dideoxygalactose transaminase